MRSSSRRSRRALAAAVVAAAGRRPRGGRRGTRRGRRPHRVRRHRRHQRPEFADRGGLRARRAGVHRREERSAQGLRLPRRRDADRVRRPPHADPGLLGPRPARAGGRSRLPGTPVRLRLLHARRLAGRHRAAVGRHLPDPAGRDRPGLCGDRPGLPAHDGRGRHRRQREAAGDRLVPAVPQPLRRFPGLRPGRRPVRGRRGRRQLQLRRLRPGREPVRRPAFTRRNQPDAARGRRRRTALAVAATRRRATGAAQRHAAAPRPRHRRRPARQPLREQRRRQRPARHRLRLAQPVPVRVPAGDRRTVGR